MVFNPLVMTNIAVENHNFEWENPLFLWWFSIFMFVWGYPSLPETTTKWCASPCIHCCDWMGLVLHPTEKVCVAIRRRTFEWMNTRWCPSFLETSHVRAWIKKPCGAYLWKPTSRKYRACTRCLVDFCLGSITRFFEMYTSPEIYIYNTYMIYASA